MAPMMDATFAPGSVSRNRDRLWRVDAQLDEVLVATSIDGGEAEQRRFDIPFEVLLWKDVFSSLHLSGLPQFMHEIIGAIST